MVGCTSKVLREKLDSKIGNTLTNFELGLDFGHFSKGPNNIMQCSTAKMFRSRKQGGGGGGNGVYGRAGAGAPAPASLGAGTNFCSRPDGGKRKKVGENLGRRIGKIGLLLLFVPPAQPLKSASPSNSNKLKKITYKGEKIL